MVAVLSPAANADYYILSQAMPEPRVGFYPAIAERHGQWWNPNSLFSGPQNPTPHQRDVDSPAFYKLYKGFHPISGSKLTDNAGSPKRSPGFDLSFTADKTISALWAICPPNIRDGISAAQIDAVQTALEEIILTYCALTRARLDRSTMQVLAGLPIGALFPRSASRANDPHLHTRALVFNAVQTCQDAKWRALHARPLFLWQKAAGAVYRAELAWLLRTRHNIPTEPHPEDAGLLRIPAMPSSLAELCSSRGKQINDIAATMSGETPLDGSAKETLRNKTTNFRDRHLTADQRHLAWKFQALEIIPDIAGLTARLTDPANAVTQSETRTALDNIDALPDTLGASEKPLDLPAVVAATANATMGRLSRTARADALRYVLDHSLLSGKIRPPAFTPGQHLKTGRGSRD